VRSILILGIITSSLSACRADHVPVSANCPKVLAGWITPKDGRPHLVASNHVSFQGDQVLWNGERVSRSKVREYAAAASKTHPPFMIEFDPARASSCRLATAIRDDINEVVACGESANCGQGSKIDWDSAPDNWP
jgi:hypothetical protein